MHYSVFVSLYKRILCKLVPVICRRIRCHLYNSLKKIKMGLRQHNHGDYGLHIYRDENIKSQIVRAFLQKSFDSKNI
jgi:hypothetical protein